MDFFFSEGEDEAELGRSTALPEELKSCEGGGELLVGGPCLEEGLAAAARCFEETDREPRRPRLETEPLGLVDTGSFDCHARSTSIDKIPGL